jgi:hypothetical protein
MTTHSSDIETLETRVTALEAKAQKGRLLAKYAERDPKEFIQYDAFEPTGPDSVFGTHTQELMRGSPCRVLIDPQTSSEDAVMMLIRITQWIEKDGLIEKTDPNEDVSF